jgi:hypothetical protein
LLTAEEVTELAKKAGYSTAPTQEILNYWLEHSGYQSIIVWPQNTNGKHCIEFQTGAGFRKKLMSVLGEALISLGGEWDRDNEI